MFLFLRRLLFLPTLCVHASVRETAAAAISGTTTSLRQQFLARVFGGRDLLKLKQLGKELLAEMNPTLPPDVDDRFSDGTWRTHLEEEDIELIYHELIAEDGSASDLPLGTRIGGESNQLPIRGGLKKRKLNSLLWLELGSFRGQSCIKAARFLKGKAASDDAAEERGSPLVLCVDSFVSKLLDQFVANVRFAGLEDVIAVWPQTTLSALRLLHAEVQPPASRPTYEKEDSTFAVAEADDALAALRNSRNLGPKKWGLMDFDLNCSA
eukprot:g16602.t1